MHVIQSGAEYKSRIIRSISPQIDALVGATGSQQRARTWMPRDTPNSTNMTFIVFLKNK
jgi:hypothetical protein